MVFCRGRLQAHAYLDIASPHVPAPPASAALHNWVKRHKWCTHLKNKCLKDFFVKNDPADLPSECNSCDRPCQLPTVFMLRTPFTLVFVFYFCFPYMSYADWLECNKNKYQPVLQGGNVFS